MKHGFKRAPGWESLFYHLEKQLCLSLAVDDFKMSGKAENVTAMWKELKKDIDLEPPAPSGVGMQAERHPNLPKDI